MNQDQSKRAAAEAALAYVRPGELLGVGTGSTVNHFIALLAERKLDIRGAVSSSEASSVKLRAAGIPVVDLNVAEKPLSVYVDGADEANARLELIKGGGGALTREKIVATASERFVCIVDESKLVEVLGRFPLPVEVIPMAAALVSRALVRLGGAPKLREGFVTDNGNLILDVSGLAISDAPGLEADIGLMAGVVTVGLFARRPADVLIIGGSSGVRELRVP